MKNAIPVKEIDNPNTRIAVAAGAPNKSPATKPASETNVNKTATKAISCMGFLLLHVFAAVCRDIKTLDAACA